MKQIVTLLLLAISWVGIAQNQDDLLAQAKRYYKATYEREVSVISDLTYPKLMEGTTKEKSLKMLTEQFDNPNFTIRWVYPNVEFKASEIKEVEGKKVSFLTYESAMRMTFVAELSQEDVRELLSSFRATTPEKSVNFESGKNSFLFVGREYMIGILDPEFSKEWQFVNYSTAAPIKTRLHKILGQKIIKALNLK